MTQTHDNPGSDDLREAIIRALRGVHDPEIPVNIYDLGLIYELDVSSGGDVHVRMTLTTPNCPMAEVIPGQVEQAVRSVAGVGEVVVDVVWEPAWTADMMSEAAKLELEFTGHTGPAHLRKDPFTSLSINKPRKDRDERR
jgi:FeS assembly SUF system protein